MFDELLESVLPRGLFLAAGVALGAAFGRQLRPLAKEAIKFGLVAGAAVQEAAAEAYERGQDLVAEARYEQEQEQEQERQRERGAGAAEQPPADDGAEPRTPRQVGAQRRSHAAGRG